VERTVFDDDPLYPVALQVRRGRRRIALIPIDAVEAVCPIARVLYVRRQPSVAARAAGGVASLGAAAARNALGAARAGEARARRRAPAARRGLAAAGSVALVRARWACRLLLAACARASRAVAARTGVAVRRGVVEARCQWPAVRRGLVASWSVALVLARSAGRLLVAASIAGVQSARACWFSARRLRSNTNL
jgi:hypothetical protein